MCWKRSMTPVWAERLQGGTVCSHHYIKASKQCIVSRGLGWLSVVQESSIALGMLKPLTGLGWLISQCFASVFRSFLSLLQSHVRLINSLQSESKELSRPHTSCYPSPCSQCSVLVPVNCIGHNYTVYYFNWRCRFRTCIICWSSHLSHFTVSAPAFRMVNKYSRLCRNNLYILSCVENICQDNCLCCTDALCMSRYVWFVFVRHVQRVWLIRHK